MLIRPARPEDAAAIAALYGHYVRETAITFACEEPSPERYAAQIAQARYPFLVAEDDGGLAGFAYAAAFREKEAYQWDAELTIYLRPELKRRGVGSRLMQPLLNLLRCQGFTLAYSCITLPNESSIGLHRRFGFETLGVFPRTGYKLGRWRDVVWMQLPLCAPSDTAPDAPRPFSALSAREIRACMD